MMLERGGDYMGQAIIYIYTTPTCDDCRALKNYLSEDEIPYQEFDVSKSSRLKDQLFQETGSRIVPGIIIERKTFLGNKKRSIFTGFKRNREEIIRLIR